MTDTDPTLGCAAWPVEWPCDVTGKTPEELEAAADTAAAVLWGLAGGRIGVCTYTERYWPPCSSGCVGPAKNSYGQWVNAIAGANCCRIALVHAPVQSIVEVTEDGLTVDPIGYDLSAQRWLRRRGGCWSCADECDDPPVTVTYEAGVPFPPGTARAVGEMGCEVLKAAAGEPCKLPSRAVNITRQGVTIQLADPGEFLTNGLTGLPLVDSWIRLVNPNKLRKPSRVYSPDLARRG